MNRKLYVGNLPFQTTDQELEALRQFRAEHGVVRCPPAFAAATQAFIG